MRWIALLGIGLALGCGTAAAAPVQVGFDVMAGGGIFALKDLDAADRDFSALTNGGSSSLGSVGYSAGIRAIAFIPFGLGVSIGVVPEGGGSLSQSFTHPTTKKGATSATETLKLSFSELLVPVGLHVRTDVGGLILGGEVGVDFATGTIGYDAHDSLGDSVKGDLTDSAVGFHLAGEAALALGKHVEGFLRLGYTGVALDHFAGSLNDNGTPKIEQLYLFRNASGQTAIGADTASNVAGSNHALADVSGSGVRATLGLRFLFP